MSKPNIVVIVAIVGIVILEAIALIKGINGTFLAISFAAISGLGGYQLRNILTKINNKK